MAVGAASRGIGRRTRKRVRSTTPTDRLSWLATRQYPKKPVAFRGAQAARLAAEENSRWRREIGDGVTLLILLPCPKGGDVPHVILLKANRRDGRVVEGARLESVFRGNSNVGSNPTLSAIKFTPLSSRQW